MPPPPNIPIHRGQISCSLFKGGGDRTAQSHFRYCYGFNKLMFWNPCSSPTPKMNSYNYFTYCIMELPPHPGRLPDPYNLNLIKSRVNLYPSGMFALKTISSRNILPWAALGSYIGWTIKRKAKGKIGSCFSKSVSGKWRKTDPTPVWT